MLRPGSCSPPRPLTFTSQGVLLVRSEIRPGAALPGLFQHHHAVHPAQGCARSPAIGERWRDVAALCRSTGWDLGHEEAVQLLAVALCQTVCVHVSVHSSVANPDGSYWQFLLYFFITLVVLELIIAPMDSLYPTYWGLLGAVGLTVEATLPIPQLLANARSGSCRGFRVSLLASWLLGDAFKMYWFFTATTSIPWAFKICGMFQAACDAGLGIQYLIYGEGPTGNTEKQWPYSLKPHLARESSGRSTPTGRKTPLSEKTY